SYSFAFSFNLCNAAVVLLILEPAMLSFCDSTRRGRREFLRVGGLALGGLSLASFYANGGSSLASAGPPLTDKSVIFLFLHGGPGIPSTVPPFPRAVDPAAQPGQASFGKFASPGPFGTAAIPFQPDGDGSLKKDMKLALPMERLDDRKALLAQLDRAKLAAES